MTDMKLTPEQSAAIDKLAQDLLVVEPQDRIPAIMLMVDTRVKALREEHPGMSEDELDAEAKWFGDLILKRFNELNDAVSGGEGHA